MSLARLFVSGLMVAGGLVLGAFTLHGYLDPQWAQKQAKAGKAGAPEQRAPGTPSLNAFQGRSQFVAAGSEAPRPVVKAPSAQPPAAKASVTGAPDAKAAKPAPKKKVAEKPADKAKAPPQPQQASFQWSWSKLFGSN